MVLKAEREKKIIFEYETHTQKKWNERRMKENSIICRFQLML